MGEVLELAPREQEQKKLDLKPVQITNPVWLGYLSEGIQVLTKRINVPTITYETLYTYFLHAIQNGGGFSEFWVVMADDLVYTSAHWFVRGLPHRGVVTCDFIHACRNRKDATLLLANEFYNFGVRHRCPYYEGMAINEKTYRVFRKMASLRGFEFVKIEMINFLGKKR